MSNQEALLIEILEDLRALSFTKLIHSACTAPKWVTALCKPLPYPSDAK